MGSLFCGSKKGKDSCCEGLVCHEDQHWRCVKDENKFCSGPGTLARDCGSDWNFASKSCCPGLECDGKYCVAPEESAPEDEPEVECAVDGEKSLFCGSKKGKLKLMNKILGKLMKTQDSCCEGLVCHEDQYWKCVKDENKFCSGPGTLARDCGSDWTFASKSCCP